MKASPYGINFAMYEQATSKTSPYFTGVNAPFRKKLAIYVKILLSILIQIKNYKSILC